MSYDFHLCKSMNIAGYNPVMGEVHITDYDLNYTSNVAPMWREAFCCPDGIKRLDMVECKLACKYINDALVCMNLMPEVYENMSPRTGWGDVKGAKKVLRTLRAWCVERPDCYIRVTN